MRQSHTITAAETSRVARSGDGKIWFPSGVWNEQGAFRFTVLPAYYQTNWFRALCVITFLAMLWTIYHLARRGFAPASGIVSPAPGILRAASNGNPRAERADDQNAGSRTDAYCRRAARRCSSTDQQSQHPGKPLRLSRSGNESISCACSRVSHRRCGSRAPFTSLMDAPVFAAISVSGKGSHRDSLLCFG